MEITGETVLSFIESQLKVWDTAKNNFEALKNVKLKEFKVNNASVKVQFNPARIVSSSAKVDAKSLKERKCFLCEENRPAVQEGLAWNGYTVLVNPFPIFPKHLTIPSNAHIDQRIAGRIGDMMRLAQVLEGFTLFYNGPKCGASAPDHMHFQAGNRGFMPIEADIANAKSEVVEKTGNAEMCILTELSHPCFLIRTKSVEEGERMFDDLYGKLDIPEGEPEPMLNVLCWCDGGQWNIVVFPRKKHRPSCYFAEGEENILLSPASVDMGGVFITPLEKDFNKISIDDICKILDEVCLNEQELRAIAEKLK